MTRAAVAIKRCWAVPWQDSPAAAAALAAAVAVGARTRISNWKLAARASPWLHSSGWWGSLLQQWPWSPWLEKQAREARLSGIVAVIICELPATPDTTAIHLA